ncbi:protein kinase domain-containing protein [Burkholderia vietnamiensis]|uniref:protein kinase domain-containing protein n=1 Tax=Burkholderia vietnamiensis TaxID=60552 RepID=UPI001CF0E5DA|nr:protein kinase [Burkholderia vietnamiensis]MCA8287311.1 protein kinase [Burkholderia vietnamiensis]
MSLVSHFNKNNIFETDIGEFTFASNIDQGGNAHVLRFKRDNHEFAIKFISHDDSKKLKRFRDEFFCAAQIPTHRNIVNCYHFDSKVIDEKEYSIIVMKSYQNNLNKIGHVAQKSPEEQAEAGWKLFTDLCEGLHHLHKHHIFHRDIKPQNIFFDSDADSYVIGDLGIAHFKSEIFPKEARTEKGERLANYLFSAPEQADSKNPITAAADIYSLGQVIQWYFTGKTNRGLGRKRFGSNPEMKKTQILDLFVNKALQDNPSARFQSIEEIRDFIKEINTPKHDPWAKVHALDDAIRYSFPSIQKTTVTKNESQIANFLTKFKENCNPNDFWYILADGGDNTLASIEHIENRQWLFNNEIEMTVKSLIVFRDDSHPYKNFFILLFGPDKRFEFSNRQGEKLRRKSTNGWEQDLGILVDDSFYISPNETNNGYYQEKSGTIRVDATRFKERYRYLVPYGVMVVPTETASAVMLDRNPTSNLIQAVMRDQKLTDEELRTYLSATQRHHSTELTKFN